MNARKIPAEVQQMFERYTTGNTRRLGRNDTVRMLQEEFGLTQARAEQLFDHFDKDNNGVMSLWEFNHFYNIIGTNAKEVVAMFEEIDTLNKDSLDVEQVWDGLVKITSEDGQRPLQEVEIERLIKSSLGDDNMISLGHFADMLAKIRMFRARKK